VQTSQERTHMSLVETHMSCVYIGKTRVRKTLKLVTFAFADFSTTELRKAACYAEIDHNTPWAPGCT
jgi:aminoglycoside phosphotransferase family enzyme